MSLVKLLYIEDDLVDQKAFERHIKKSRNDYEYAIAGNLSDAEKLIQNNKFDVIVTDYKLPDGTGLNIVNQFKQFPIILVTGQGDEQVAVKALKDGAFDYIVKEPSGDYLEQLSVAIHKAVALEVTKKRLGVAEKQIQKLLSALSQVSNAIIIFDRQGNIEWVNKGFEDLYGFTFEEVKNKPLSHFRKINSGENELETPIQEIFQQQNLLSFENKIETKSGKSFWAYTIITPVIENSGRIEQAIIVDTDITEKKEIENQLLNLNNTLQLQNQELQQFTFVISHNMRSPITNLLGLVNIFNFKDYTDPFNKQVIEKIGSAAKYLDSVIIDLNALLTLRNAEKTKEMIDLKEEFEQIQQNLADMASTHDIVFDTDFSLQPKVMGSKVYVHSILQNLISNSIKFKSPGRKCQVKIRSSHDNGNVVLSIEDNGIGINLNEHGDKLFNIYHRFSPHIEGKGVGLYIVKTQVEQMGGSINVQSSPGIGTRFTIRLPA